MFFKNTVPCSIRMYDNQENIISQFNSELPLCNTIQVNNTPNIDIMKGCEQSDLYVENFLKINYCGLQLFLYLVLLELLF